MSFYFYYYLDNFIRAKQKLKIALQLSETEDLNSEIDEVLSKKKNAESLLLKGLINKICYHQKGSKVKLQKYLVFLFHHYQKIHLSYYLVSITKN